MKMGRHEKHTRDILLRLAEEKPNEILKFKGHLKWLENSDWITFSKITIQPSGDHIASHINLPKKIINKHLTIQKSDNHKVFIIIGNASFYVNKGTKRGAIKLINIAKD